MKAVIVFSDAMDLFFCVGFDISDTIIGVKNRLSQNKLLVPISLVSPNRENKYTMTI